ncbi:hypothetical protein SAMN02745165_03124 [Malonomonas rubra DSM 5091]|uniref:Uncharacterized protein n=1 Tax=Malonomonas rubra DSM 5091 TaxID=1122189 RepID=A0A1M6M003_MALRU|nr:hypothetical protein [Malonomonas rubra]SHJ76812.1 hypothetical protein SAMN02745165_03124 [Malonomonas rubra DSM 5091]
MAEKLTISKQSSDITARNYQRLREEGLEHVQLLSRKLWTDYNIHDPGITSLELLCYAITDLGYRISQPLPDLLALPEHVEKAEASFPTAAQVLPTRPVTVDDYRRLLIDIPGIRNAWLLPDPQQYGINCERSRLEFLQKGRLHKHRVEMKGLYRVLLELEEDVANGDRDLRNTLQQKAWQLLQASRNLCEDFTGIQLVRQKPFCLCAEIELAPDAEIDLTEARIFRAVQQFLTPPVKFYSLQKLLDKGTPVETIFEGPLLQNGFLAAEELAASQIRQQINLSDILQEMMQVEGVQAVRDIVIAPSGAQLPEDEDSWIIPVWQEGQQPLQPVISTECSRLVFYKDLLPFQADFERVENLLAEMEQDEQANAHPGSTDLPIPAGRYRNSGDYQSIQQHYPRAYGISDSGLPESASDQRKAQARQLQAYLLFFDQVLANYFAQLGNVRQLFTLDPAIGQSYFSQVVAGVTDADGLYADPATLAEDIQSLTEDEATFLKRRNRFLDHLLARFAENFNEYVWTMYAHDRSNAVAEAARAKREFLRDYPSLSVNRGGAFDYSLKKELWDTANISGLSLRIGRLLGIRNLDRRNLANVKLDIYDERDRVEDDLKEYRFRIRDDRPEMEGKILLSSSWKFLDSRDAREEMQRVLGFALDRSNYQPRVAKDGRYYFNLTDGEEDILARRIEYFATEAERDAAIDQILDLLQDRFSDEGLFLVEHLLLRPQREIGLPFDGGRSTATPAAPVNLRISDRIPAPGAIAETIRPIEDSLLAEQQQGLFLPICTGGDCSNVKYIDPYSCRISIILPAWPARFSDIDFRRFAEKTIRQETPAHILPKICWVDRAQMAGFEKAYKRWLQATFGSSRVNKQTALAELVKALSNLRSVYPEATLAPCDFILDRAVLGRRDG